LSLINFVEGLKELKHLLASYFVGGYKMNCSNKGPDFLQLNKILLLQNFVKQKKFFGILLFVRQWNKIEIKELYVLYIADDFEYVKTCFDVSQFNKLIQKFLQSMGKLEESGFVPINVNQMNEMELEYLLNLLIVGEKDYTNSWIDDFHWNKFLLNFPQTLESLEELSCVVPINIYFNDQQKSHKNRRKILKLNRALLWSISFAIFGCNIGFANAVPDLPFYCPLNFEYLFATLLPFLLIICGTTITCCWHKKNTYVIAEEVQELNDSFEDNVSVEDNLDFDEETVQSEEIIDDLAIEQNKDEIENKTEADEFNDPNGRMIQASYYKQDNSSPSAYLQAPPNWKPGWSAWMSNTSFVGQQSAGRFHILAKVKENHGRVDYVFAALTKGEIRDPPNTDAELLHSGYNAGLYVERYFRENGKDLEGKLTFQYYPHDQKKSGPSAGGAAAVAGL
uniref:Transmembrane protein n=1 Tax=Meloidogyne hapla TaxID=6305 RepID=A0A1I8B8Y7_MELHA